MAPINTLTTDVVKHIMHYIIPKEIMSLRMWKLCLPYLAVNQAWRDAIKPRLYMHAIVVVTDPCYDGIVSTSNSELIRSQSAHSIPSRLYIETAYTFSWGTVIKILHNTLMHGTNIWHNIQWLNINIGNLLIEPSPDPTSAEIMVILHKLPNISTILFTSLAISDKSNWVSDKIVNYYMHQLLCLNVEYSVSFLDLSYIAHLTSLDVSVGSKARHLLPYMCSDALQTLCLSDIPHDFSWIYFQKNTASHVVDFAQLKTLALIFADGAVNSYDNLWVDQPPSSRRVYTLNLPCVESINVRACPPNLKLVQPDDSTSLKSFDFEGSVAALAQCSNVQFGSAQDIDVHISVKSKFDDGTSFYEMTNKLFNNEASLRISRIHIGNVGFTLRPQRTMWTQLKGLKLISPIKLKSLLQLLYRLPNVVDLTVRNLAAVAITDINLRTPLDYELQQILLRPLDTKIERLRIAFKGHLPAGTAGVILQTLMIQITSLSALTIQKMYVKVANNCKAMTPYQHLHVSNISIKAFE